ncbi:MAG TPA: flagellar motor protein [Gaiellales bacterium]|nr:flagellar motor protein [Gaiellales bacterium]
MKANTAIGVFGAVACLILAVIMEGGSPASLLNLPALLIVVGGTGMATFASTTVDGIKNIPKLYKRSFGGSEVDPTAAITQMVGLAEKARRDGLLALENDLAGIDDAFTRTGIQLVVDGTDSDLVRNILQSEIDGMSARHRAGGHLFATAGGFAPTLGILGTVLSLVHVLENLSSPGTLGHSIAGAFLATLYGVGSANLIFLPVANKLKELSAVELLYREMLLEAVLSIQAGDNPRMLREKLETFIEPAARGSQPETASAPAAPATPAAPAAEYEMAEAA